jgi:hypothetical protein
MTSRGLAAFIIFLFYFTNAFSQTVDSLAAQKKIKTKIYYLHAKDFIYGNPTQNQIDTSLSNIHHVNPALDLHYNFLGTEGSANESQIFSWHQNIYTFNSIRSYDLHMLSPDSMRFYRTNKRFSELQYHSGNFKEQRIAFIHTQNITKTWNAGFHFDRQGVKDFMNFSNTFRSRFALYTWYASPNSKYNLFAFVIWNNIKNGVNGGLLSDSLFDNTIVTNVGLRGLAYRISNASENVRKRNLSASQYYDFGKIVRDSSGNIISRSPALRLNHTINFERRTFTYIDPDTDSSFYKDYYYGTATYDSIHCDEITNRISVQLPADTLSSISFFKKWSSGIYAEQQHVTYGQKNDSIWNNVSIGANIFMKSGEGSTELFANGSYVINGFDVGNYILEFRAFSPQFIFGRFGINLSTSQTSADLNFRWYDSNNFRWTNHFASIQFSNASVTYELEKYNLKFEASRSIIDNYVFLNSISFPSQFSNTITIDQLKVIKNFNYRFWHFDNNLVFQNSSKVEIIPVPSLVSEQALYFQKHYFNHAILMAFGLSLSYNNSYYANYFMPATGMFELQYNKKTGGYPRFDIFINSQIKTARIFIKLENILDDLFQNGYYLTPHYPMPGRVLKFGLVWRFFDV